MPQVLPWKLKQSFVTIEDGYGNSLQIPSYGSLTLNEFDELQALEREKLKDADSETFDFIRYEIGVVSQFLRSRFELGADVDPLDCGDGLSLPLTMVHAINQFLLEEAGRQKKTEAEVEAELSSAGKTPSGSYKDITQDAGCSLPSDSEIAPSTSSSKRSTPTKEKAFAN